MAGEWTPAAVPDEQAALDVGSGIDTDGDTRPDTLLTERGGELLIHTDLDGDGIADQILGIALDGAVSAWVPGAAAADTPDAIPDTADSVITVWEP